MPSSIVRSRALVNLSEPPSQRGMYRKVDNIYFITVLFSTRTFALLRLRVETNFPL